MIASEEAVELPGRLYNGICFTSSLWGLDGFNEVPSVLSDTTVDFTGASVVFTDISTVFVGTSAAFVGSGVVGDFVGVSRCSISSLSGVIAIAGGLCVIIS